jgi:integrase
MAKEAGVACTLHVLRHTFVTQLLRNGVPVHVVSAMAGHKNPTVTLTVYSHVLSGDQEDAASTMDKALQRVLVSGTNSVPTSR